VTKLPRVTEDTMSSLDEIFGDISDADKVLFDWLLEMEEENPVVTGLLRDWVKVSSNGTANDQMRLMRGPIFLYQLLKAQAEVDSVAI
jgi:hypothetical protein